jgi:hypothetical protein
MAVPPPNLRKFSRELGGSLFCYWRVDSSVLESNADPLKYYLAH